MPNAKQSLHVNVFDAGELRVDVCVGQSDALLLDVHRRVSEFRAKAIGRLLNVWVERHADHVASLERVLAGGIQWNVEQYRCTSCGTVLKIRTDYEMLGDVLDITVTPEEN